MARLTISVPDDIDRLITDIAAREDTSKTEIIRRAFAILKVAEEQHSKGGHLGIVRDDEDGELKAIARIIGL